MPEGKTLEFKRDLSSPKNILKTLVAFTNTAGGTIIIGRDDQGTIVGIDDVLAGEERLANLIADKIAPAMMPDIEVVTVENRFLLIVQTAHWPGPFYLKEAGPEAGVFVRLGSTNRQADSTLLDALRRLQQNSSFDQLSCPSVSPKDLDDKVLNDWFSRQSRKKSVTSLESLGILIPQGGTRAVSHGGVVLFGRPEVRKRIFPDARFFCARFRGRDKSDFLDRLEIDSLLEAFTEVPRFISRNTRLASRITGMQREDIPEYPVVAVREVLVNAVAHGDYSSMGMSFFISIFSDRLEIQSPGMFPFGMTLENFKAGVSRIRNRVICRVLNEMGLMESWGTGYQRITESCRKGGYPDPEWQELGSCIRVIFKAHPYVHTGNFQDQPESDTRNELVNEPGNDTLSRFEILNERQKWFLLQLGRGAQVKAENIKGHWEVSLITAKRDIAHLKKLNRIEYTGARKNGFYRLKTVYYTGP